MSEVNDSRLFILQTSKLIFKVINTYSNSVQTTSWQKILNHQLEYYCSTFSYAEVYYNPSSLSLTKGCLPLSFIHWKRSHIDTANDKSQSSLAKYRRHAWSINLLSKLNFHYSFPRGSENLSHHFQSMNE